MLIHEALLDRVQAARLLRREPFDRQQFSAGHRGQWDETTVNRAPRRAALRVAVADGHGAGAAITLRAALLRAGAAVRAEIL